MNKLLIVGVDPGTTLGYAVMDIDGDVLNVDSSKQLNTSTLIARIRDYGKVLIVGCDRAKIPYFVNNFAVKIGAKVSAPKRDLTINEKKALARNFEVKNSHQIDALASCLNAYKNIRPLLDEIDVFLRKRKKQRFSEKVKETVIKNDFNMRLALSIVEKRSAKPE